ncbi:MAG: glycosyltransferase, partial [Chloroflexota bacterium]
METRPKVTVIVPVHNPGPALERSIASVLAQTMPPGDLEAIFVDDGSTDGSGARLDEVAAASPHVRVLHIPASGSPGRPRNLALAEARGDYVQFLDADDRLAPGAAERGHATAVRNGADIVVAKLVSDFRSVSWDLFRTSREACSVLDAPLIANLTVSKLFRTAFLREHDIRFPEGWSKIEDERFVVRAYLAARVVSVDADEPAYFYCGRADGGNLSSAPVDPGTYCEHLREILGLVTAGVEAGEPRTRLLRRFYRTDMLGRLGDEAYLAGEDAYRSAVFASVRALALETMDDEVHAGLGALLRLRSTLLREGRPEALLDLARRSLDLRLDVVAGPVETTGGGLQVPVRAGVHWADGTPLALVRDGDRLLLDPRLVDGVTPEPFDVAGDVDRLRLIAAMRDRDTAVEWVVPPGGRVTLRPVGSGTVSPVLHGSLALDPDGVGPGRRSLDPGAWEVIVRVRGLDHDLRTPLLAGRRPPVALPARLLRRPPGLARAEVVPGEPVVI